MMKKLFIPSILAIVAVTMVLAPTFAVVNVNAQQQDVKPDTTNTKKCQTKIQVKATGVTNGTEYTATLLDKSIVKIAADQETLSFTFNFNKAQKTAPTNEGEGVKKAPGTVPGICPAAGSELQGDVNGKVFDVTVADTKKPTRVSVDVSDVIIIDPEPEPEEPPVDPPTEPNGTDTTPNGTIPDSNNTNTTNL
jgi:hypothetical protein